MNKKYIIIGSSAAGMSAIATLRQLDQNAQIVCVSDEAEMPYNKCLLPDVLGCCKKNEEIFTRPLTFFQEQNIQLILGKRVISINPEQRTITLADGAELFYDKLLVATGMRARQISFDHTHIRNVFYFYSLKNLNDIMQYCADFNVRSVLIIGAGLTGLECADALASKNIEVTVVEGGAQLLSGLVTKESADVVQKFASVSGVRFVLNESVAEIIQKDGHAVGITTAQGKTICAQMVIIAAGAVANTHLVSDAGGAVSDLGIITDRTMKTSLSDIYAAGDCAQVFDRLTGNPIRSFKWSDAAAQGICAAHAMADQPRTYAGVFRMNGSHIFGKRFFVCGDYAAPFDQELIFQQNGSYARCALQSGVLVSAILVGYEQCVAPIRQIFTAQTSISPDAITTLFNN